MELLDMLEKLDDRERLYVEARLKGMAKTTAMKVAGMDHAKAGEMESRENVQAALKAGRVASVKGVLVDRDKVVQMLLDAYDTAETAGEKVAAARELGKLLGLYEAQKVKVTHEHSGSVKVDQIKQLSTKELERLARGEMVIEGSFEVLEPARLTNGTTAESPD